MRVVHLAHGHPALIAGGTEVIAQALSRTMDRWAGWESRFIGAALPGRKPAYPGTAFGVVDGDAVLNAPHFERLMLSQPDARGALRELGDHLAELRPDVVHFHHLLNLGAEAIAVARRAVPGARLVMTLHDYYPICHNDGLMRRTATAGGGLCEAASPVACAGCFPEVGEASFRLRELYLKNALSAIDAFAAPSRFLAGRYRAWGLPGGRIHHIPNGYPRPRGGRRPAPPAPAADRPVRFGFFGHLNHAKGAAVVLAAVRRLVRLGHTDFEVVLHGSDRYAAAATQETLRAEIAGLAHVVTAPGGYDRGRVGDLMRACDYVLVPSVWWENDPLVIKEAFLNRRPVICSDIGGLKAAVRDGVDGLHAGVDDPDAWARAMARALQDRGLAGRLGANAPGVPGMQACARRYAGLYTTPDAAAA